MSADAGRDETAGRWLCGDTWFREGESCPVHGAGRSRTWEQRPAFALDADVTVYWPDVRPCWEQRGPSVRLFCSDCPAEHQDEHLPDCAAPDSLLPAARSQT